mmetsp:Transcript_9976/g.41877  ORF Transcript_9976/g.41877 Transcript_9976/m.41877 type:complete len:224 (+) Transcript_9976:1843-2514(+)
MPEIIPPPETGTMTASRSGTCSKNSTPMVPWPAMTSGWSYGGIRVAPVSRWSLAHVASRSLTVAAHLVIRPPYVSMASSLHCGAPSGTTMYAGQSSVLAASANAAAWFPELCVTTPFSRSASLSRSVALIAPRNLNAPPFWNVSHLKKSRTSESWGVSRSTRSGRISASMVAQRCTGVFLAYGAMRSRASWIISRSAAYSCETPPRGEPGGPIARRSRRWTSG